MIMLLGLKGTMSRRFLCPSRSPQRQDPQQGGARELRRGLPVGLVWGDADGEIKIHPDEAVQTSINRDLLLRRDRFGVVMV